MVWLEIPQDCEEDIWAVQWSIYPLRAGINYNVYYVEARLRNQNNASPTVINGVLSQLQRLGDNYDSFKLYINDIKGLQMMVCQLSSLIASLNGQHGNSGIRWWRKCWYWNYGCWFTLLTVGPDEHPLQLHFDSKFYVLCYFFFQYVPLRFTRSK